jgi:hypothetical protein
MKEFLKSVLASAFGTVLALCVGAFLLVVLLVGLASSSGERHGTLAVNLKPKTMLVIGGGLTIEDTPEHGAPGFDQLIFGAPGPQLDLLRALEAIDLAAKDKQIAGILLSGELSAGLTQKAELRRADAEGRTPPGVGGVQVERQAGHRLGRERLAGRILPGERGRQGLRARQRRGAIQRAGLL